MVVVEQEPFYESNDSPQQQHQNQQPETLQQGNGRAHTGGHTGKVHLFEGSPEELARVDLVLVDKVRELLKAELLNGEEADHRQQLDEKYSHQHYEDLMDPRSPFTCWRYLVSSNLKLDETLELIKGALIWRKQNGAEESVSQLLVKEFWFHSPIFFCGINKSGSHTIYVIGRHYRKPGCSKLRTIVRDFCSNILFNWDREHRHDLGKVSFVFDISSTGYHNIDLEFIKWFMELRSYFPERTTDIYVTGIPYLMRPIVNLVISWLPQSISKLVKCGGFEELIVANIELDNVPVEMGGTCPESLYRVAPVEIPWARDTTLLTQEDNMLKYLKNSIWCHVTPEREQKFEAMQEEYENKTLKR